MTDYERQSETYLGGSAHRIGGEHPLLCSLILLSLYYESKVKFIKAQGYKTQTNESQSWHKEEQI